MTVGVFLTNAAAALRKADVSTGRLDCLVLLEDAFGADRANLLAHLDKTIPQQTEVELNTKIAQRIRHVPLAYIRGKAMFYGREFTITGDVLVPRPESESMIDLLKALPLPAQPAIADIGTGSGCLGITTNLEVPASRVWLCDIDQKALKLAMQNSKNHGVNPQIVHADLLHNISAPFDVLLANLPYVPLDFPINRAAEYEPKLAIFAGANGLDVYRRFWNQVSQLKHRPNFVITESLNEQHAHLSDLAANAGYALRASDGLAQCFEATR
ncbi:MAG: N5-glutamine methyltransferase family protein [Candidatus Saccharimonadales bacterium]